MRQSHRVRTLLAAALLMIALVPASRLRAQVLPLTIDRMAEMAGTIFVGTVSQVRGTTDERGNIVTYTTFTVEEILKGKPATTLTIKQLGGETATRSLMVTHMRYFRAGERLIVLLHPVSELGFTSPVGLSQGVFEVGGDARVGGLRDALLAPVSSLARRHGVAPAADGSVSRSGFVALLRELGARKGESAR